MLLAEMVSDNKMLVTYVIFVSAVFCRAAGVENSTDFLDWFKTAITAEVPTLELVDFENKSYYLETVLMANYYQATQFCNFHKMRLLTVTSQKENDFLEKAIHDLGVSRFHFWTSGTVLPSGHWVWMSSGRPIIYTNWGNGEPNGSRVKEVCLEMRILDQGFAWNDLECSTNLYFICECPANNRYNLKKKPDEKNSTTKAEIGSLSGEPLNE
ncbi:perlucin-like isoform X2 [Anoplophora glabripennis]|uniref:perlucin-like isoform X2 n=1 Tax=Anoplophora glabripennis TaxID=217634 RepID=UPI00087390A0|nr:perlucin-like isoform X2 [Anoplophora glabripennis]